MTAGPHHPVGGRVHGPPLGPDRLRLPRRAVRRTRDIGAMLLIEVDGASAEQVEREYDADRPSCAWRPARWRSTWATHPPRSERMWRPRQNIAEAFKTARPDAEPGGHRRAAGADPRADGRAGAPVGSVRGADALLRPRRRRQPARPRPQEAGDAAATSGRRRPQAMLNDCTGASCALGGTISGEHGIGSKRAALSAAGDGPGADRPAAPDQAGVRSAGDPEPGKIFPD